MNTLWNYNIKKVIENKQFTTGFFENPELASIKKLLEYEYQ